MNGGEAPPPTIHASAVCVDEIGLVIRGASGAGKSSLALAALAHWQRDGRFAALVADDRVILGRAGDAVVASAPAPLRGLLEVRFAGLTSVAVLPRMRVRALVDLVPPEAAPRLPDPCRTEEIGGVPLPMIALPHRRTAIALSTLWTVLRGGGRPHGAAASFRPLLGGVADGEHRAGAQTGTADTAGRDW